MESLATTVTVTGAPAERIVPEDDGLAGDALPSWRGAWLDADRHG
jgi:hypothetical protein